MTISSIKKWLLEHLKASFRNAKKVHGRSLKTSDGWIRLVIALSLYLLLSYALISDDIKLGLSFIFSGFMVIYSGTIYKGGQVMGYVLLGVILGTVVTAFISESWHSVVGGDWIGSIILFSVGVFLWVGSSRLKSGKPPDNSK
jgi:hypothetical protein